MSHLDHPGWAAALAGIETEDSRAFVTARAKDMAVSLLRTMTRDDSIACCFPQWKRDIYTAELRSRPIEVLDYAEGKGAS